jgi:hypothetical protein
MELLIIIICKIIIIIVLSYVMDDVFDKILKWIFKK